MLPVAEELVGALTRQGDGDVLRGEVAQCAEPQRGQIRHGLVEMPHERLEIEDAVTVRQLDLVMLRAEERRDEAGICSCPITVLMILWRECLWAVYVV